MVEIINELPLESTVRITGKVVEAPKVKLNGMEIIPTKIEVTSRSEDELPFNFKDLSMFKSIIPLALPEISPDKFNIVEDIMSEFTSLTPNNKL